MGKQADPTERYNGLPDIIQYRADPKRNPGFWDSPTQMTPRDTAESLSLCSKTTVVIVVLEPGLPGYRALSHLGI